MIIGDHHVIGFTNRLKQIAALGRRLQRNPDKANAILIIDPDTELALAVALQRFESVRWRIAQIAEPDRLSSTILYGTHHITVRWKARDTEALPSLPQRQKGSDLALTHTICLPMMRALSQNAGMQDLTSNSRADFIMASGHVCRIDRPNT